MASREPDWARLGAYVRDQRTALGLTKSAAATTAKVSLTTWRGVEAGTNHKVSDETLVRIAKAIQIESRELLTRAGRRPQANRARTEPPGRLATLSEFLGTDPDLDDRGRRAVLCVYEALTGSI